jgi:hypothetical protein
MEVTDWLAIYAAILSTVIFGWDVLRARPKVKARLIFGLHPSHGAGAYISVQNTSSHTVHLAAVSALYKSSQASLWDKIKFSFTHKRFPTTVGWVHTSLKYHGIPDGCPVAIEPGNAHQIFLPEEKIETILQDAVSRDLMANPQDMLWRNSYSNILSYPFRKDA